MSSAKSLARVAGILYLMMALTTAIAGYARGSLVGSGDRSAATLFRVGVTADLVSATLFLLTAMALYVLVRDVDRLAAAAMVTFVAISVAIQALNLANELVALSLATGAGYASSIGQAGAAALTLLYVQVQHDGF